MAGPADIAIIGGTGLYSLFEQGARHDIETPYGPPSSSITVQAVGGKQLAFLARHGEGHKYPPHRVPYRANMWALAALGVTRVLAVCAAGSLRPDVEPGSVVVPDQLIDRTHGREATYYDDVAIHVSFADPFCPQLRAVAVESATGSGLPVADGGTVAVISGPRFGTRAEAAWHRQSGADLVNMTAAPEAILARELALCYCTVAVVTDWDAGVDDSEPVSQQQVIDRFAARIDTLKESLLRAVNALPRARDCPCADALAGVKPPDLFRPFLVSRPVRGGACK